MNELCKKGAGELASMIRSRQVTSAEVIEAHLARIEEVNPNLNAVTVTLAGEARAAAAAVDRSIAAGAPLGPLAGIPFTIKENIDVAGSATTWGVAALAEQIASVDAPVVARLREAGAIANSHQRARLRVPMGHRERSRRPHPQPVGSDPHVRR